MPLPPYIAGKRPADAQDMTDYQTVFAKNAGAVAAPTASLHFDQPLLDQLAEMGVRFSHVTLHVGAGTFLPVKVDDIADHKMHSEWGQVSAQAAAEISATKAAGGRVIPLGPLPCGWSRPLRGPGISNPGKGIPIFSLPPVLNSMSQTR